jgi:uroporphyrinogen decarboxylase
MHYQEVDCPPALHWGVWEETRERWENEGLPGDADVHDVLGTTPYFINIGAVNSSLFPGFQPAVLEETETYRICRERDGVTRKSFKKGSSIPQEIDTRFKTGADWPAYKEQLQPDTKRICLNHTWKRLLDTHPSPLRLCVGSLIGRLRNYMGVENMIYMIFDTPEVLAEYVDTASDLACWIINEVVGKHQVPVDCVQLWEDICGSTGPLISPEDFKRYVAPGYRKIRDTMTRHGIEFLAVDCDGQIDALLPAWLEAGVNILYPMEIGAWDTDLMAIRQQYGPELRMIGGYNKHALEKGPAAIDAELERRLPLMQQGGYVLMPDHLITPDTPLGHYQYYLQRLSEVQL